MLFRIKPVIVEAFQWKGETGVDAMEFMIENGIPDGVISFKRDILGTLIAYVKTLEGEMRAMPGSWIIRASQGEYYPVKPDIFERTYEAVESPGKA